jgi:hypothetical protein
VEKEAGIKFSEPSIDEQIDIIKKIKKYSDERNITLYACAEDQLLNISGIEKAHCIDQDLINKVTNSVSKKIKSASSRPGCGCIESRDIGYYDSCPHGCIYCYANMDPEKSLKRSREYLKK